MSVTREEMAEAIALKKRLSKLVRKSGNDDLIRADKAYHERLRRYASENDGDDLIVVMGGNT